MTSSKTPQFGVRVTGLPNQVSKEDLRLSCSKYGKVVAVDLSVRSNKLEGRVFYSRPNEMYDAVFALHDYELFNKRISVTILLSNPKDLFDVHLTGHPADASKIEIRDMINSICQVKCIRITNKGKYCFIQMHGRDSVDRALQHLNGAVTEAGHKLTCQISQKKEKPLDEQQLQLAKIMNQICEQSNITPAFSDQDMHILEKSQRTFHLSGLPIDSDKSVITDYFQEYGDIESSACVVRDNFRTAYGFVVFKSHRASEKFRNTGIPTFFVENSVVKISPSKPTRSVNELANTVGFMDSEHTPTHLLFQVLSSGVEYLESQYSAKSRPKQAMLQDPNTGMCYLWNTTEGEYAKFLDQEIQMQMNLMVQDDSRSRHLLNRLHHDENTPACTGLASQNSRVGTSYQRPYYQTAPQPLAPRNKNRRQCNYGPSRSTSYPKYSPY